MSHIVPGNESSDAALGPGAFFSFAAEKPHETNNEGEEPALLFIFQEHPWILELDLSIEQFNRHLACIYLS
jgi:hypothetical protein